MTTAPHYFPRILLASLVALASACGGDGSKPPEVRAPDHTLPPDDALVYQSRGGLLCGSRGMTPEQGARTLINGGIDVIESGCGTMTNVSFPAVCGASTGDILLHEIRRVNLPDAEKLGFKDPATLADPPTNAGYAWVNCDTGEVLP